MPYYPKKTKAKRKYKRRYAKPRKSLTLSGFPLQKVVKLRYVDSNVTLNPGIGAISVAENIYRCNSVFDPDYTGTGHQPMGFDQWAALYTKYTVLGSKITMIYTPSTPNTQTNITPGIFGVTMSKSAASVAATYSSIDNLLESKLTTDAKMFGYDDHSSHKIVKNYSAKKFHGFTNTNDNSHCSAVVTTNPALPAYFQCWAASIDGNDPNSNSFRVQIDYIVMFHDPTNLDGS